MHEKVPNSDSKDATEEYEDQVIVRKEKEEGEVP